MCYAKRVKALGLVALAATLAVAGVHRPAPEPATLEDLCVEQPGDPCTRHALDGFRDALAAQRAGTAEHPLRVSYFGDSLTADDHITNALRVKLQALLGDGGPGFVFAAPPHPFCQHRAVARVVSEGWHVTRYLDARASRSAARPRRQRGDATAAARSGSHRAAR